MLLLGAYLTKNLLPPQTKLEMHRNKLLAPHPHPFERMIHILHDRRLPLNQRTHPPRNTLTLTTGVLQHPLDLKRSMSDIILVPWARFRMRVQQLYIQIPLPSHISSSREGGQDRQWARSQGKAMSKRSSRMVTLYLAKITSLQQAWTRNAVLLVLQNS